MRLQNTKTLVAFASLLLITPTSVYSQVECGDHNATAFSSSCSSTSPPCQRIDRSNGPGVYTLLPDFDPDRFSLSKTRILDAARTLDGEDEPLHVLEIASTVGASSSSFDPNATIADLPPGETVTIKMLTRQILLKLIALEKFNLNYRLNAAKQGRWKGLRYALMQEAGNALGITGGIIGTYERGRHLHTSQRVSRAIQQQANFIPAIGSILAASAAIVEFHINEWNELVAWHKGFSPAKAKAYVLGLKTDIDRLLAQRQALVDLDRDQASLQLQAQLLEGKILKDLRDLSLLEFARFHIGARRTLAFQQAQYFLDTGKFTTNALGAYMAYLALHRRDRAYNQRAGILYCVAGGLVTGAPILSRGFGLMVAKVTERNLHYGKLNLKELETKQVEILQQDQAALEALMRKSSDRTEADVDTAVVFADRTKRFQDQVDAVAKERAKGMLTATQNIGAGLYVGGSKIASGTLFSILGRRVYRRGNKDERASRVTNHLLFASGVIGLQASSFAFFDTLRIQIQSEIARHKLAAANKLPVQLIASRLKQLESLENRLKNAN